MKWSPLPPLETNIRPSGENAKTLTGQGGEESTWRGSPTRTSDGLSQDNEYNVSVSLPIARIFPSGERAADQIPLSMRREWTFLPDAISQKLTIFCCAF